METCGLFSRRWRITYTTRREVGVVDEPIVYLSTWRIKDGKFPEYQRFYAKLLTAIRERDRDVVAFFAFGNADGTEITNVHVFPSAPTLDRHMAVIGEQMGLLPKELSPVLELMEPLGLWDPRGAGRGDGPGYEGHRGAIHRQGAVSRRIQPRRAQPLER